MSGRQRSSILKERVAYEAARIIIEQGLPNFDRARRKAAERTGVHDRRNWPSNETIQEAVLVQRRLFRDDLGEHQELLDQALSALRAFADFSPRLIGAVLRGTGDRQTGIELFLFSDLPEDVIFALIEQRIPWREGEREWRYPGGQRHTHPVFRFMAGDIPLALIVLPMHARQNPPLDPVTERPQRGADLAQVERMLAEDGADYRFEIGR